MSFLREFSGVVHTKIQGSKMLAEKQVLNSSNAYKNGPIWRRN